jgi:CheY-like chemotaxis protein/HEAT repeat protein
MSLLTNFQKKMFMDQVMVLNQIGSLGKTEELGELLKMYQAPSGDTSLDSMIEHTIRDLLNPNPALVLETLNQAEEKTRKLCLSIIAAQKMQSAAEVLVKLLLQESNSEFQLLIAIALDELDCQHHIAVFRSLLHHENKIIAALALENLGKYKDMDSIPLMEKIIIDAENNDNYLNCSIITANAIEALGWFDDDSVRQFLAENIHHRNPTARRLIHDQLIKQGEKSIPHLKPFFSTETKNDDLLIMAANIIGFIGHKKGADILIEYLDMQATIHENVLFAIYEALGHISSVKGLVCLHDALEKAAGVLLMAVIIALDKMNHAASIARIREMILSDHEKKDQISNAIILCGAMNLFEKLYADEVIARLLIAEIEAAKDPFIRSTFRDILQKMDSAHAVSDLSKLEFESGKIGSKWALVVDDSKAIVFFYRNVCAELGLEVITAYNGQEALDQLDMHPAIDMVITDMNMPVMDGMELSQKVRALPPYKQIPILMCTTESEQSQIRLAENIGITDFISKPIVVDTFKATIRKYLDLR